MSFVGLPLGALRYVPSAFARSMIACYSSAMLKTTSSEFSGFPCAGEAESLTLLMDDLLLIGVERLSTLSG